MKRASCRLCVVMLPMLSAWSLPLAAHDAMALDKTPSAHGGPVRMAGPYHIELVLDRSQAAAPHPVRIFLQSHAFQDVTVGDVTGSMRLEDGARTRVVRLKRDGFNSLSGVALYQPDARLHVAVTLKDATGQRWLADFTPFAAASAVAPNHN